MEKQNLVKKAGNSGWKTGIKKRGPNRGTVTLGGLKKIETAKKRKKKRKINRKLGLIGIQEGWKKKERGPLPPTRSVIFLDNTPGGELSRRFQEAEAEAGKMSGYRVRIAEAAGTPLSILLPSTNPWGPSDCERLDCVTCKQEDENRINCRQRNILYESECTLCAGQKVKQKDGNYSLGDGKGIYVGESSRSIYERAKEHEMDKVKGSEDSHQIKHWLSSHEELLTPPSFKFKIVRTFQDPLTRQLSEAVRIDLRGDGILNSKAEYSRCRVPRLVVDMECWKSKQDEKKSGEKIIPEGKKVSKPEDGKEIELTEAEEALGEREQPKRKTERKLEGKKPKRRKLDLLEGWGLNTSQEEDQHQIPVVEVEKEQKSISEWAGSKEAPDIPVGRIGVSSTAEKRRVRGKLSRKEIIEMQRTHHNIQTMWSTPKTNLETEKDESKSGRLDRVMQRQLEWKARKDAKMMDSRAMGDATSSGGPKKTIMMKERGKDDTKGGGGGKRRSQKISELCEVFEGEKNQPTSFDDARGEGGRARHNFSDKGGAKSENSSRISSSLFGAENGQLWSPPTISDPGNEEKTGSGKMCGFYLA